MELKTRHIPFEVKAVDEEGTFEGLAAVYGSRDQMGDILQKGAFTRTLEHRKGKVPVLWNHNLSEVIGAADVADSDLGLQVKGHLNLAVARAREVHALLKQKAVEGLSFGFDTIKAVWSGSTRLVQEVRLWEVSVTPFNAHDLATVASVKAASEGKPFADFESFEDCVSKNGDKDDPEAFCAFLQHQVTGEWPGEKSKHLTLRGLAYGVKAGLEQFKAEHMDDDMREAMTEAIAQVEDGMAILAALLKADSGDSDPSAEELRSRLESDTVLASLYNMVVTMQADLRAMKS